MGSICQNYILISNSLYMTGKKGVRTLKIFCHYDELELVFLNSAEHLKFSSTDSAVTSLWKYI